MTNPRVDSQDVDELLVELKRHFQVYVFPDRKRPTLIAAKRKQGLHADVVRLRAENDALAWRTRYTVDNVEPFQPRWIVWHKLGQAAQVLRALLGLPRPDEPDAPTYEYEPHPSYPIPSDLLHRFVTLVPPLGRHLGES